MCGQRSLALEITRLLQIVGRRPAGSVHCAGGATGRGRRHVDNLEDVTVRRAARRALEVGVGVARAGGGSHHWHGRECEAESGSDRLQANGQACHGTLVLGRPDTLPQKATAQRVLAPRSSARARACAPARGRSRVHAMRASASESALKIPTTAD